LFIYFDVSSQSPSVGGSVGAWVGCSMLYRTSVL
jgi:hypothetical protein